MSETSEDLTKWLAELSALSQQYQELAAPIQEQITALEAQLLTATAHLTFQMETLASLIKPLVLAGKQTQKVPYVTMVYTQRDGWDKEVLLTIAKEVPAVMQAYRDASFVAFRKTSR